MWEWQLADRVWCSSFGVDQVTCIEPFGVKPIRPTTAQDKGFRNRLLSPRGARIQASLGRTRVTKAFFSSKQNQCEVVMSHPGSKLPLWFDFDICYVPKFVPPVASSASRHNG